MNFTIFTKKLSDIIDNSTLSNNESLKEWDDLKREVKKMDDWRNENINDLDYRFEEILNA